MKSSRRIVDSSGRECGVAGERSAFVTGGNATELGEFPWAALLRRERGGREGKGGAVDDRREGGGV